MEEDASRSPSSEITHESISMRVDSCMEFPG
jgi:hypothetical protein